MNKKFSDEYYKIGRSTTVKEFFRNLITFYEKYNVVEEEYATKYCSKTGKPIEFGYRDTKRKVIEELILWYKDAGMSSGVYLGYNESLADDILEFCKDNIDSVLVCENSRYQIKQYIVSGQYNCISRGYKLSLIGTKEIIV